MRIAEVVLGGFFGIHVLVVDVVDVNGRGLGCAMRGGRGCGGDRCLVGEQADEICGALGVLTQGVRVGAGARGFAGAGQGLSGGVGDKFEPALSWAQGIATLAAAALRAALAAASSA